MMNEDISEMIGAPAKTPSAFTSLRIYPIRSLFFGPLQIVKPKDKIIKTQNSQNATGTEGQFASIMSSLSLRDKAAEPWTNNILLGPVSHPIDNSLRAVIFF